MATADTLVTFTALSSEFATASFATLSVRNSHPLITFAKTASSSVRLASVLPRHYSGGGVSTTVTWHGETATVAGAVLFTGAFERLDGGTTLFADAFAANVPITTTVAGTAGLPIFATLSHTAGAQMDTLGAGEPFVYEIFRHPQHAADTMPGNACVRTIEIRET